MTNKEQLERGRAAFQRQSWSEAYAQLSAANGQMSLDADDLLQLALASSRIGSRPPCNSVYGRAVH